MTAEEMFKKEGYEKLTKDNIHSFIDKNHPADDWELSLKCNLFIYVYKTESYVREICFTLYHNVYISEQWEDGQYTDIGLGTYLLKAINMQLEELEKSGEW